jgi:UDP-GlcNAc:undecaprenyl-phosphate GlcNAc-1-phosphate transferase
MTLTGYVFLIALLIASEVSYLRLARYFGIVDRPNERSSHTGQTTIRGGGVLFWIAAWGAFVFTYFDFPYFFAGLSLVAAISFLDDLHSLANRYRISMQFIAISFMLYQTTGFEGEFWMIGLLLIIGVGILNAYNFMDGINGITAFYSLVTVGTFWYSHTQYVPEGAINNALLPFTLVALLIFSYFNARSKAICFAGDVGSVSIAFIILYALVVFIKASHTYLPILFLAVYGIDSVLTITHRIYLGHNIFQAHRLHLFQLLVHKKHWSHLRVSALYALVQLGINGLVLAALHLPLVAQLTLTAVILGVLASMYVAVKLQLMKVKNPKSQRAD